MIKHLLMHMSGLRDWDPGEASEKSLTLMNLDDWVKLPDQSKLKSEPGSAYAYNNADFDYLGKVIEAASGENYYSYLEKHIFKPARMADTSCPIYAATIPNMSRSYQKVFEWGPPFYFDMSLTAGYRGGASGCAVSTVEDLARFATALRWGVLLHKSTFETFTTPRSETRKELQALGFQVAKLGQSDTVHVGHGGNLLGNCTRFGMFDYHGSSWTFAILSNSGLRACAKQREPEHFVQFLRGFRQGSRYGTARKAASNRAGDIQAGGGQDKGSCSHQLLSDCLHIVYSGDSHRTKETIYLPMQICRDRLPVQLPLLPFLRSDDGGTMPNVRQGNGRLPTERRSSRAT